MDRRDLLRGAAATAAVGLSGCVGPGDGGPADGASDGEDRSPSNDTGIGGTSFAIGRTACGAPAGEAAVTVEADEVRVEGTIAGDDTATTADLESTRFDRSADVLRVGIRTVDAVTEGDVRECPFAIDYSATVGYDGSAPGDVTVYHDGIAVDADDGAAGIAVTDLTIDAVEPGKDGDAATVRRETGALVVEGTIGGADGCAVAAVDGVGLENGRVTLDLVTYRARRGACTDAAVGIDYRATVAVAGDPPTAASVRHGGERIAGVEW